MLFFYKLRYFCFLCLLIGVFVGANTVYADNIDSLKQLLNGNINKQQTEVLLDIAKLQKEKHPSISLEYYKKALIFSQKIENKKQEFEILIEIGEVYKEIGKFEEALDYFLMALNYAEEKNMVEESSNLYNLLGIIYANLGNNKKSLYYLGKHLRIQEDKLDREQMVTAYNNIANIHFSNKDYEKALKYCNKAIDLEIELSDAVSHALTLNNVGLIYLDMKDYEKALNSFEEALNLAEACNSIKTIIHINSNLVDLYVKTNKNNEAKNLLDKNIELAKSLESPVILRNIYEDYYLLQEKMGNYKQAFEYYKLYDYYNDSVFSFDAKNRIAELKVIYDSKNNEKENEILRQNNEIKSLELARSKTLLFFSVFVALLSVLLVIVLVLKARNNRKNTLLLERKNADIDQINSEINALNLMLEKHVEERTRQLKEEIIKRTEIEEELRDALEKAEKAIKVKDTFLANMSHEIRTPLNAIIGLSSLVEEKGLNSHYSKHIKGIRKSSEVLLNYFNNILEYSQIKSEDVELNITNCKIDEIIETAMQIHAFSANEKGLEFNLKKSILPLVKADCNSITKVVSEVIENAVKYTSSGSINISTLHIPENNEVYIQIADTGIGIDEEYLPYIFDTFSQEDDGYSKSFAGIGIGLPLSKRLVELMNGRIEIASKKNKGTIVKIFLPVFVEEESAETEIVSVDDMYIANDILKESGLEILIIEDDEFNALILEHILVKIGNITTVPDGKKALEVISNGNEEHKKFDIMIVDINLPGKLDGIELMKIIKEKWSYYNNVPFIAQTAYAMSKDRERLLKSGFDDYISKPIDNDELLMIIKSRLVS